MSKYVSVAGPITSVNGININRTKKANSTNYSNVNGRTIEYIVFHYTGNNKDSAWGNANYFQGANRDASAHYFVDDEEIYQCVDLCDTAWHCGAYTYYHASCRNANSIGIEMCCSGNYKVSATTKENSAQLGAALCKYLGITDVDKYVVRHYDVSHKKCPAQMAGANNAEWNEFKARIKAILNPAPAQTDGLAFKVGDIVNFTGKTHFKSANALIGSSCNPGEAKVSAISKTGKHPYHLIKVVGGTSNVYGWVNVADVKAKEEPKEKISGNIDTVKEVQIWLNDKYNAKLEVDGGYGPLTKAALVKVLQKALNVSVDGVYGPETNCAVENLYIGSEGQEVEALQGLLVCNGYKSAYVDGGFGNDTKAAVIAYQKKKKLVADGIAGKATFSALCK